MMKEKELWWRIFASITIYIIWVAIFILLSMVAPGNYTLSFIIGLCAGIGFAAIWATPVMIIMDKMESKIRSFKKRDE